MVSVTAERIDDVSVIWFDNPPVNALGSELRIGIAEAVKAAGEQDVAGIVLASRSAMFSAARTRPLRTSGSSCFAPATVCG